MKIATEPNYDQSAGPTEPSFLKRISWRAIFAGVSIAAIIQLLLTLLGVGIGAASVNPLQERNPGEGLAIGGAIWFFVSAIIAMYVGGRVAGRFSNCLAKRDRMHHGIFTWAVTTILSMVFLASAMSSLLGSATGAAAGGSAVQAKSNQSSPADTASMSEADARQRGEVAAKRVSQMALATFFLLLLSGAAAALGGASSASDLRQEKYVDPESGTHGTPAFAK